MLVLKCELHKRRIKMKFIKLKGPAYNISWDPSKAQLKEIINGFIE